MSQADQKLDEWNKYVRREHARAAELKERPEIAILCHFLFDYGDGPYHQDQPDDPEYDSALTGETKAEVVLRRLFAAGMGQDAYISTDA